MNDALDGRTDSRATAFGTLFVVAQHLDRLGDIALAPLGLTTKQWLLLAVISRGFPSSAPSLTEAAALYGSSRQNVKAIAGGLAERGYLHLVEDPADRRVLRLEVTPKTAVFAGPDWAAREEAFFSFVFGGLAPTDVDRLAGLLQRWLRAVTPAPEPPAPARSTR
jgi:DNA-binding MarR family transcriptional regulator